MDRNEIWSLYSTFPNREEALSVAHKLLEKKLIACANLLENITSIYRWEGAVQQEQEVLMIAKTTPANVGQAIAEIKKLHSYQLPCIVAYPIAQGHPSFLQWVADETRQE
jgi:periplasmic divalent cation tolerance protein